MDRIFENDNIMIGYSENESMTSGYSEEELVRRAQSGDAYAEEHLIRKYKELVKSRAHHYYMVGADRDDIVQEGMIGLYKAIRDYRSNKLSSFRAFAELCITRQIISAIKTATRQKHSPLNSYVSLNRPMFEDESERTLLDVISEKGCFDPEEIMINKEDFDKFGVKLYEILSTMEIYVLSCYLKGISYQEIAVILSKSPKSIDNALQRVKRKIERYLEETIAKDNCC